MCVYTVILYALNNFNLLENKQCCNCNKSSNCVCSDCSNEPDSKELYLCNDCSVSWHNHPSRQSHRPCQLKSEPSNDFRTGKLQLLSVLCIETSHYVCFTRATRNDWVFFDSMAERLGTYIWLCVVQYNDL